MVSQFSVAKRKSTHKQDVVSLERRVFYRHHTQRYRYIPGYEIRCSSLFLGGMVVYVVLVHFMHALVDSLRSFSLAGDGDDWGGCGSTLDIRCLLSQWLLNQLLR